MPSDAQLRARLKDLLSKLKLEWTTLPGIGDEAAQQVLVEQFIESVHRVRYIELLKKRGIASARMDPSSPMFDPIKASILHAREGRFDEACWLIFLFVHFGKNAKSGYRLLADIYGALGEKHIWSWERISADPFGFRVWLDKHDQQLRDGSTHRAFGNHRKYQSLSAWKKNGTGAAVETYVAWIASQGGHKAYFEQASLEARGDAKVAFDRLYREMRAVASFGRVARFDFLTMIGKIGLADIKPGIPYMQNATGPLRGARLLFGGSVEAPLTGKRAERLTVELGNRLGLGMQEMEDALCNWQKSPTTMVRFRA